MGPKRVAFRPLKIVGLREGWIEVMEKMLRDKRAIVLFMAPAMLFFVVLMLVPIIWSTVYSFYEGVVGIELKFVGFQNYAQLLQDTKFLESFVNTMEYVLIVSAGQVVLGLLISLVLYLFIHRQVPLIRTIVFLPMIVPTVAAAQLWSKIYEIAPQYGLINSLLMAFGLGQYATAWLGTSSTALIALCIADIWKTAGFYSIVFYGALIDVPNDYVEAARIDGARNGRIIWKILLPMMRPTIVAMIVFSLTSALKVYESPYVMTRGGPGTATQMMAMQMYDTAFSYSKYGYGSSIAVVMVLCCLLVSVVMMRFDREK